MSKELTAEKVLKRLDTNPPLNETEAIALINKYVSQKLKAQREETNSIIRSFYSVIERKGNTTNWNALEKKVKKILKKQHKLTYPR